jgi:hypothetical protein
MQNMLKIKFSLDDGGLMMMVLNLFLAYEGRSCSIYRFFFYLVHFHFWVSLGMCLWCLLSIFFGENELKK